MSFTPVKVIKEVASLRQVISTWKSQGEKICFVPTMGALHDGHLALVDRATKLRGKIVVSIFVNPLQFDNEDDLRAYPDTLSEDVSKLTGKVDAVFTPSAADLYPDGTKSHTSIKVPVISDILEGGSRPGHFDGVTTVVGKLFSIILPDYSFFGEKDYQQLLLIRKMSRDLFLGGRIVGVPTVREENGLAMSSRNKRLTVEDCEKAAAIYRSLSKAEHEMQDGRHLVECCCTVREELGAAGIEVDEIFVRDAEDLSPVTPLTERIVILVSAWVGKVRLIDNVKFNVRRNVVGNEE